MKFRLLAQSFKLQKTPALQVVSVEHELQGEGVKLKSTPVGSWVSLISSGQSFNYAWHTHVFSLLCLGLNICFI